MMDKKELTQAEKPGLLWNGGDERESAPIPEDGVPLVFLRWLSDSYLELHGE